jgi:ribokinase
MTASSNISILVLGSFVQACCWKVARLPKAGETVIASALSIEMGGKGLNIALGTRRLGAKVDALFGIGSDSAGEALLQLLQQEGLSTNHVWQLSPQSGYGAGLIADDGQNTIAVYLGANLLLTDQHIRHAEASICAADLVYGQLETSLTAIAAAFHIARSHKVRTVLNLSPWQVLPKSLLDDTDIILVNEVEAHDLLALNSVLDGSLQNCIDLVLPRLDSFWYEYQTSLLVITLGAIGSLAFERNGSIHRAAAYDIVAVDSVGAGDAFASGFCMELCKGKPIAEALRYGNACGAYMAAHFGVLNVLPTAAMLQDFLG